MQMSPDTPPAVDSSIYHADTSSFAGQAGK